MIERGLKGRYISPVRIKNKLRSTSPAQSITSVSPATTPTQHSSLTINGSQTLNWRLLQRDKLSASGFDADKSDDADSRLSDESVRSKSKLSRTIGSGYSVPYRDKRNPLSSTRLSCYKPISADKKFDISSLKNYKSVDDFLSLGHSEMNDVDDSVVSMPFIASSRDLKSKSSCEESVEETPKMSQPDATSESGQRAKKHGISNKLRSMSDKTHKLFSRLYSHSNLKSTSNSSSSDVCNDFILQRPSRPHPNTVNSRRSLSYGTLPGINEFEIKKIETEDGDSGILVNESGASSMVETDSSSASEDPKTEIEVIPKDKTTSEIR